MMLLVLLTFSTKWTLARAMEADVDDQWSDSASLCLSLPSSSAKQTDVAVSHRKDFKYFQQKKPNIRPDDISHLLTLQGSDDVSADDDFKLLAIDVESIKVYGQGWKPQRITITDRNGEALLDEIVSDWALKHKFQQIEEESPFYAFNLVINRFRSDRQLKLLQMLTDGSDEDGFSKVCRRRNEQNNQKLIEFVRNTETERGDRHAIQILKKGEITGKMDDVVKQFVRKFGKSMEEIQDKIRALIQQHRNVFFIGHGMTNDIKLLSMPDVQFKTIDTQLLYKNYRQFEDDDPIKKPSLKLLARNLVYWKIQETEPWMDSRGESNKPGHNVKGPSLYGHSSLEDSQAAMLLLLNKIVDDEPVREETCDIHRKNCLIMKTTDEWTLKAVLSLTVKRQKRGVSTSWAKSWTDFMLRVTSDKCPEYLQNQIGKADVDGMIKSFSEAADTFREKHKYRIKTSVTIQGSNVDARSTKFYILVIDKDSPNTPAAVKKILKNEETTLYARDSTGDELILRIPANETFTVIPICIIITVLPTPESLARIPINMREAVKALNHEFIMWSMKSATKFLMNHTVDYERIVGMLKQSSNQANLIQKRQAIAQQALGLLALP